jgi:hypothetical protein
MTTLKAGDKNLLRLADYIERRQRAKPRRKYNQLIMNYACGAPSCAVGHAQVLFGVSYYAISKGSLFALTADEYYLLFDSYGCNNAGTDWRKAVKYIRDFVAARRASSEGGKL